MVTPSSLVAPSSQTLGQKDAAHPHKSAWVAASAGTGKTKVLTDRVMCLLLSGASPEKILCLTFTKAGATEMLGRLMERLGFWATAPHEILRQEVEALLAPTPAILTRARTLFTFLLDHPTGLSVQTLHSFCQSLLQRFPLEAGVSCAFSIADDTTAQKLLSLAQQEILACPQEAQKKALIHLAQTFGQDRFQELFESLFQTHQQDYQSLTLTPELTLQKILKLSPHLNAQDILDNAHVSNALDQWLKPWLGLLIQGGKEDNLRAQLGGAYLQNTHPDVSAFKHMCKAFLTQEASPRARLLSKALALKNPQALDDLTSLATFLSKTYQDLRTLEVARISYSFFQLFSGVKSRYAALKDAQGLLDYEDLIDKACALLHDPSVCDWVRYKMDGGLDHILVDEAQDTNARQWALIHALTEEFFSGMGARTRPATLFAVGDVKQSIYRFQGAAPQLFETMRGHFAQKARLVDHPWQDIGLNHSFRSTRAVLEAVDCVFSNHAAARGVRSLELTPLPHHSARSNQGGHVQIWPLVKAPEGEDALTYSPERELAHRMAAHMRELLDKGYVLASTGKPIQPRDMMVLMQRRHRFVGHLTRALKAHNIPVSGEDRLMLVGQLAVQDLLCLGKFLLFPQDDWNTACLLKTPLIGFGEEDLFTLCHAREKSLWQSLAKHAGQESPFGHAHAFLSDLLRRVDHLGVFELFAHVLLVQEKMTAFVARLGTQVQDVLYAFLEIASQDEKAHGPCLQSFLARFEEEETILKRDFASNQANEVRILTVHGSKGLQAPLVFLPDTTRSPTLKESFLWQEGMCLWIPPQDKESPLTRAFKAVPLSQLEEDSNRLLYVAMTRAQDVLHICGWESAKSACGDSSWYALTRTSLAPLCKKDDKDHLLLSFEDDHKKTAPALAQEAIITPQSAPPSWLRTPLARESDLFAGQDVDVHVSFQDHPYADNPKARTRGTLIHHLLEWLPRLEASTRKDRAHAYLKALPQDLDVSEEVVQEILQTTLRLLGASHLQRFFSPHAKREVTLTGMVQGRVRTGRVDLLLIEGTEVLIVDFKSDQNPPKKVPQGYIAQLELYRALLTPLYPLLRITTWILWTSTGELASAQDMTS